ncbi:DUF1080 domain-containing protein [Isoptericola haloaureus]|uniref:DUF1080 domain-containing protein n=1 Tax=Isoptericola haloaureus TaxID=1542902 RepID=A0ABU7Z7K9_9MICO
MSGARPVDDDGFRPLFDGSTLAGWHAAPRVAGRIRPGGPLVGDVLAAAGHTPLPEPEKHPARWFVDDDGSVVGEQATPGYGGYLVSDESFGDIELVVDVRPDWPADTGVMLRRRPDSWEGFQVLLDHRPSGGIGGFFGNGLASFSAVPFAVDAVLDDAGRPVGLRADDPATSTEPVTPAKRERLTYAADVDELLEVWRWDDWNELRIRCVGALPTITTWVDGVKIAEVDTSTRLAEDYVPDDVLGLLGPRGRLALEVHDNDPLFGASRWGPGARCRWRDLRVRELDTTG